MLDKSIFFREHTQGVQPKILDEILKNVYVSIESGALEAIRQIIKHPDEYDFRNAKPVRINSFIKKEFIKVLSLDEGLRKRIIHYKSHGVDYFLAEGKFLICLKRTISKIRFTETFTHIIHWAYFGQNRINY